MEPRLSAVDRQELKRPFEEEEILAALREMNLSKTPGPNGMKNKVLQQKWTLFREDALQMFRSFHLLAI
ncbi:hypothetical protein Syun_023636 [Stephania yunnanensis]|uniref:Uncharacterized protein n=1 Tax=Stephania yunnanensis TaxID=152371 RepID=A0AAP0I3K1_9MAGN